MAAIQALAEEAEKLKTEKLKPEPDEEAEAMKAEKLKAEENAKCAENARVAERQARIADALAPLVESGHVLANEREAIEGELLALDNEAYAARVSALRTAEPKIKTESEIGDLGKAKADTMAANERELASQRRRELIAEEVGKQNPALNEVRRFEIATGRVRKLHPELFAKN
jgi:hypothetical protein